jgi:hypothetical protein
LIVAKKFIIVDGFIVAGKGGGEVITEKDVDRIDVLLESGRVIPATAKPSSTMKDATESPKED